MIEYSLFTFYTICAILIYIIKNEVIKMNKLISKNPTARHNYEIIDTLECGIVLSGTEIKSIRNGKVN